MVATSRYPALMACDRRRARLIGVTVVGVTGVDFDRTKKFRDAARSGRAAIVVDDMVKLDPSEREAAGGWDSRPRGIEVRGRAEAITGRNR